MIEQGRLYVFEGPDGVGKTTLARALTDHFKQSGTAALYYAFPGRAPGTLGEHVYRLHHAPADFGINDMNPISLQVLHVAAHIDAIDRFIGPALREGTHVVLDRFWWSTWVYGVVSGANRAALDGAIALEEAHWGDVRPAAAFLVTRSSPLRDEGPQNRWETLCRTYADRVRMERDKYPVFTVTNEGATVAPVLDEVLGYMGQT